MSQMIENHMVIGDYYPKSSASVDERADALLCDAMNCRNWEWMDHADLRDVVADIHHKLYTAKDAQEGYTEARAVLEAVIEAWADEEARSEQ